MHGIVVLTEFDADKVPESLSLTEPLPLVDSVGVAEVDTLTVSEPLALTVPLTLLEPPPDVDTDDDILADAGVEVSDVDMLPVILTEPLPLVDAVDVADVDTLTVSEPLALTVPLTLRDTLLDVDAVDDTLADRVDVPDVDTLILTEPLPLDDSVDVADVDTLTVSLALTVPLTLLDILPDIDAVDDTLADRVDVPDVDMLILTEPLPLDDSVEVAEVDTLTVSLALTVPLTLRETLPDIDAVGDTLLVLVVDFEELVLMVTVELGDALCDPDVETLTLALIVNVRVVDTDCEAVVVAVTVNEDEDVNELEVEVVAE